MTHSFEYLRAALVDERSLTTLWGDGGLVWAVSTALGSRLAGMTAFSLGKRIARRSGQLGLTVTQDNNARAARSGRASA